MAFKEKDPLSEPVRNVMYGRVDNGDGTYTWAACEAVIGSNGLASLKIAAPGATAPGTQPTQSQAVQGSGDSAIPILTKRLDATNAATITANAGTVVLTPLHGLASWTAQITGTWVGTIVFEVSPDGATWYAISLLQLANPVQVFFASTTSNGLFEGACFAQLAVRVRATAWTSGTANVSLRASDATPALTPNGATGTIVNFASSVSANQTFYSSLTSPGLGFPKTATIATFTNSANSGTLKLEFSFDGGFWYTNSSIAVPVAAATYTATSATPAPYYRITSSVALTTFGCQYLVTY